MQPSVALAALLISSAVFAQNPAPTCSDVMDVTLEIPVDECNICMVGCAPYVSASISYDTWTGVLDHMADHCALVVHVGDTIPSGYVCNDTVLSKPLDDFKAMATTAGIPALYTLGDNECNDCHRKFGDATKPAQFYKAKDARDWVVGKYFTDTTKDLTGKEDVTTQSAECPFNVYIKKCNAAVVTLEVPGSYWYMADESKAYPDQYTVDPFEGVQGRIAMYQQARDCTLAFIDESMEKAKNDPDVHSVMFFFQASFWTEKASNEGSSSTFGQKLYDKGSSMPEGSSVPWYNATKEAYDATNGGENPFKPLADKLLA
eukprot:2037324-Rhodomonas_salina.4